MNLNRLSFFLIALFIYVQTSYGQENVTIHIDKPYYVSGEVVWYKIYLPEEFRKSSGKVKAIIQSSASTVVDESFVQLTDAAIAGYYRIPYDLSSDLYHFSFYAVENDKLTPLKLFTFEVPIYNDLSDGGFQAIFPSTEGRGTGTVEATTSNRQLEIIVNRAQHNVRSEVSMTAKVKGPGGSLVPADISIAVVDNNIVGAEPGSNCVITKPLLLGRNEQVGLDERIFIQGKISDAATGDPAKVSVIGAYNPDENKMYYAKSGDDGRFTLLMKDQIGPSTLQIAGYLYEEYNDTKIALERGENIESALAKSSSYDDKITAYLENSNKRKRIYQHFNQLESDLDIQDYSKKQEIVRPNKSFNVKEYVTFESVGKFFDEILGSQLTFHEKDGAITARMFNPESNKKTGRGGDDSEDYYYPRSPVFIVDGKMTKDAGYIYNLKLDNVKEIDLYYDWRDIKKQYGTFGYFGYVVIRTALADAGIPSGDQEDIITYSGLQPIVNYPISITSEDRGLPMLKPLVYWNPETKVSKEGDSRIKFITSDDASSFKVIVVARTQDGEVLTGSADYKTVVAN